MKLLYTIAPYTAPTHNEVYRNIQSARLMAEHYWKLGYAVICPHLNSAFMSGLLPEADFLSGTLIMMKRCDVVAVHPNYQSSTGSIHEVLVAKKRNMEILYYGKE
jgi:hypothetical protein